MDWWIVLNLISSALFMFLAILALVWCVKTAWQKACAVAWIACDWLIERLNEPEYAEICQHEEGIIETHSFVDDHEYRAYRVFSCGTCDYAGLV